VEHKTNTKIFYKDHKQQHVFLKSATTGIVTVGLKNFEIFKSDTKILGKYPLIVIIRDVAYIEYQHSTTTWKLNIRNSGFIIIIMGMHNIIYSNVL
jgi:hypothetical protein